MLLTHGIVLGHHISSVGIKVVSVKIKVMSNILILETHIYVCRFLGNASYYRCFVGNFTKIASPLFALLSKYVEFVWLDQC